MYSTIIELSSSPIAEEAWATHEEIPDWFRGSIADYTEDADDRALSIRSFAQMMDSYADFNLEENCMTLQTNAKERYFQGSYSRYKEAVAKLAQLPLEAFSGADKSLPRSESLTNLLYSLQESIEDRFGIYIYEDEELTTFDEWLRYAANGTSYYIGGVMAYHY